MTHNPKDLKFLGSLIDQIKTTPPPAKISEYVEGRRVFPQDAPYPGPLRNDVNPYMVEIMDNMAPSSPIRHTILMKSVQITATTAAENILAYFMDAEPANIMMMSATGDSLQRWADTRLETMLNEMDLRKKLTAATELNKKSRKTGDTSALKLFPGGALVLASAQSPNAQRSFSARILLRDEIDGAPIELATGEGNWLAVSERRTTAYGQSYKIFDFSTPTTYLKSNIYQQFLKGDQRYFNVPCPHCGELQVLKFGNKTSKHGLKGYLDEGGILDHAYYVCEFCEGMIYDHHKRNMFLIEEMGGRAKWVPTAIAQDKFTRSYQLNALYSPLGFWSFSDVYRMYLGTVGNIDNLRSFTNLAKGWPFKETGTRPKIEKILALADGSNYRDGNIPDEVVFTTMAADVQTGEKDPRIEIEICGHGDDFRTASCLYKVFHGPVDNANAGAWADLKKWFMEGGAALKKKNGVQMWPKIVGIDSGTETSTVYQFCASMKNFYPMKGRGMMRQNKNPNIDEFRPGEPQKWKIAKTDHNDILLQPNTVFYKEQIYNNLAIKRPDDGEELPRGFCNFPMDRGEKYFQMLIAETKMSDGSFDSGGRRNEALDVRVYNLCLADFMLSKSLRALKEHYRKEGMSENEIEKLNYSHVFAKIRNPAG